MIGSNDFRSGTVALRDGGHMPVIGFGTLIADPATTVSATRDAIEAGYRHFDCAERYRNEREVGAALKSGLSARGIARDAIFVTTKLWNSNHRPERVGHALDGSLERLGLDYLDLYLVHTPFAFQAGDEQDPRDANGNVFYDEGVTLLDTWHAMEELVDRGRCRAIGLSDITLSELQPLYDSAKIKPAAIQVESHPYLPETELLAYCNQRGHRLHCVRAARAWNQAGAARRSRHCAYCRASGKNAGASAARVGRAARHGGAHDAKNGGASTGEFRHFRASFRSLR
ncbi:putative Aldehyde reductase [Paraburkholderia piptadeniae]|uniref:Aldehyde reductase n=1 Tax=Paraburkholderia piptadeniae TaxID=1701573 RepID=A0A1N7RYH7_9BURK|nr:putative Aldehyde reductase [Paraburkholderia piptadeniae]